MNLVFLGYCSNSFSSINTVSFLLRNDKITMLFDCGPSVTNNLHAVVENLAEIEHVFISHSHFDHFLGLPYFMIGRHLDVVAKRKQNSEYVPKALHVYLPKGLKELIINLICNCHSDIDNLSYPVVYHDIDTSEIILNRSIRIIPFEVDHSVKCYGFIVYEDNCKLLSYSSDTLYNNSIVEKMSNSRYLIVEGMVPDSEIVFSRKGKHATFKDMLDIVNIIKPETAFVVHLQPRYLVKQHAITDEINSKSTSNILFPEIMKEYVLRIHQ